MVWTSFDQKKYEKAMQKEWKEEGLKAGHEKGLKEGREEGLQVGREEAREDGIKAFIESTAELGIAQSDIENKLREKYLLTDQEIGEYIGKYMSDKGK